MVLPSCYDEVCAVSHTQSVRCLHLSMTLRYLGLHLFPQPGPFLMAATLALGVE